MGRNLFRGKALIRPSRLAGILALIIAVPGTGGFAVEAAEPALPCPKPATADAIPSNLPQTAALQLPIPVVPGPDLPPQRQAKKVVDDDPPLQGHIGDELFDIPVPDRPEIQKYRNQYLSADGLKYLTEILKREQIYGGLIAERLAYYGLPKELLYLPVIESDYSVRAVSRSGATGLWQFMRNSVRGYGIRINDWVDERRDFWKSTDASLRKLKDNYETFGDWYLAIGAYNCGDGAMARAIRKGGTRDYWELRKGGFIPKETREYVPKFLAVSSILRYSGRNGLPVSWDAPVEWSRIPVSRAVDISLLAEKSGVPLATLKAANAELRYNLTPPDDDSYYLKIPVEFGDRVTAVLNDKELQLIRFYLYKVKSGDTLSALARYYGVSVDMILRYNQGLKPSLLKIGAMVVVPALKDIKPYVPPAREVPTGDTVSFTGTYTVVKGDTLWSIALHYDVQPETLAEKNGLTMDSIIREGTVLSVPIVQ